MIVAIRGGTIAGVVGGSMSLLFCVLCIKRRQEVFAQDVGESRKEAISHRIGFVGDSNVGTDGVGKLFL